MDCDCINPDHFLFIYFSKQNLIFAHLIPSIKILTSCSPNLMILIHKDEIHKGVLSTVLPNFLSHL